MTREFIPYEQALALKELGFDEPCFGLYHNDKTFYPTQCKSHEQFHGQICTAPLYQQSFRWFREKYKLEGLILPQNQGQVLDGEPIYFIAIISYENELMKELFNSTNQSDLLNYNPREQAELECLKKLIEIVKKKYSLTIMWWLNQ